MEKCDKPQLIQHLVGKHKKIMDAYLEGCMGECYVDNLTNPCAAQIIVGDFCFFVGEVNEELIHNIKKPFIIITQNEDIESAIEKVYHDCINKRKRYAFKHNNCFDQQRLESFVSQLPIDFQLRQIDESLYYQCLTSSHFRDLCAQFKNYQDYHNHGLGFVIVKEDKIVAGASSYIYYRDGIEIEVDTHSDYRHQGFATICSAKLILECLQNHLYPYWDAQNKISMELALKLGYQFDYSYVIEEINI
ncbi:MAG: GNAT family N-acetyltransferase [Coprobacillus cateniformis]|uniref:GNAT family N-acetyltransferase n=1 Tax=Longibaculum muris TaxID=1796628 RepID=UPI003AB825EC|nr:GNAT family N-acetyltransferase [Coprobacillus cateniformis]